MAHNIEPMDIDNIESDFDNKENSFHHSNVLPRTPCTEKGYEELDVSELNMKLRYSITPASSPMSKSYTANCLDNRNLESGNDINSFDSILTRSFNSMMTKSDNIPKPLKLNPLQVHSTEPSLDNNRNASVLRELDTTVTLTDNNTIVTITSTADVDENLSLPSSSSSTVHTPEATTPTKDVLKHDGGSPIMRGLKSVLNMFRPSQSPIPPVEEHDTSSKRDILSPGDLTPSDSTVSEPQVALASTPIAAHRNKDGRSSKRSSPLKDSIVFNEDLEKELLWKDETTILFSQEKIPIHKLFYQQSNQLPSLPLKKSDNKNIDDLGCKEQDDFNSTVEYMDISQNDSIIKNKTIGDLTTETVSNLVDSDNEFVDCETTFINNETELLNDTDIAKSLNNVNSPILNNINDIPIEYVTQDINEQADVTKELDLTDSKTFIEKPSLELISEDTQILTPHNIEESHNIKDSLNEIKENTTNNQSTMSAEPKLNIGIEISLSDNMPSQKSEDVIEITSISSINHTYFDDHTNIEVTKEVGLESADRSMTSIFIAHDTVASDNQCERKCHITDDKYLEGMSEANISSEALLNKSENLNIHNVSIGSEANINTEIFIEQVITAEIKAKTGFECESFDDNVTIKTDLDVISQNNGNNTDVLRTMSLCAGNNESQSINYMYKENVNKSYDTVIASKYSLPVDIPLPDGEDFETENYLTDNQSIVEDTSTSNSKILPDVTNDLNTSIKIEDTNKVDMVPISSVEVISTANFNKNSLCENEDKETNLVLSNYEFNNTEHNTMSHVLIPEIESQRLVISDTLCQSVCLENNVEVKPCLTDSTIKTQVEQTLTETCPRKIENVECLDISELKQIISDEANDEHSHIVLQDMNTHEINGQTNITDILERSKDLIETTVNSELIEKAKNQVVQIIETKNGDESTLQQAIVQQNENPLESNTLNIDSASDNNTVNNNTNIKLIEVKVYEKIETPEQNQDNGLSIVSEHLFSTVDMPVDKNSTDIDEVSIPPSMDLNEEIIKETFKQDLTEEMEIDMLELSKENNAIMIDLENINDPSTPDQIKNSNVTKDNIHEEIIVSENNSPYVLVSVDQELETENTSISKIDDFEKIENPFTTESKLPISPPISPKITSKGYNFNFDEIDDPFATKTNIRVSPPLDSPKQPIKPHVQEANQPKNEINNKNKRKSQPERKKDKPNKNFNSSIDSALSSSCKNQDVLKSSVDVQKDTVDAVYKSKNAMLNTFDNKTIDVKLEGNNPIDKSELENNVDNFSKVHDISGQNQSKVIADIEEKLSDELSFSVTENKDTSSSEQSVYFSAATSSGESVMSKNVFNIPEIDDKNFNPFVTKSKMHQSPPPNCNLDESCHNKNTLSTENNMEDKNISTFPNAPNSFNNEFVSSFEERENINVSDTTCSSKTTNDKNVTVREVHTDDDDTIEGPFLEVDKFNNDKMSNFVCNNSDMIQFNELPPQANEDLEAGELFIDAEAFEFLLNQNKSNIVADSGKESLFLKFDPLFAKRMSSEGVLAALNKLQKRQSTPKKMSKPLSVDAPTVETPIAGPSTFNVNQEANRSGTTDDSVEDVNTTTSKPMMVVTPAVNPIVTPRKSTTPTSSNRRSITLTSPAIAVIDRLLSLSANNSLIEHDTTVTQVRREQNEADLALTQLRDLLAEKEISVYNLRSESKELKNRLSNLESQMRTLESESEERLKKVNELTDKLSEKTKLNRSMAVVVEEYERTIASLIAETEQDKKLHNDERMKLIKERDEQTAHLASMEVSFSDLHSKYEKSKQIILTCKANEDTYKKSIKEFEENLSKMQSNYELLKQHATSKLNHANQELEKMNRAHEADVVKLNAMIKRKELHITSLEETLTQKTKANEELTAICDELINKVG
ncbi:uncharacterized protein ACR2FA_006603 [Aphomia sociella]